MDFFFFTIRLFFLPFISQTLIFKGTLSFKNKTSDRVSGIPTHLIGYMEGNSLCKGIYKHQGTESWLTWRECEVRRAREKWGRRDGQGQVWRALEASLTVRTQSRGMSEGFGIRGVMPPCYEPDPCGQTLWLWIQMLPPTGSMILSNVTSVHFSCQTMWRASVLEFCNIIQVLGIISGM